MVEYFLMSRCSTYHIFVYLDILFSSSYYFSFFVCSLFLLSFLASVFPFYVLYECSCLFHKVFILLKTRSKFANLRASCQLVENFKILKNHSFDLFLKEFMSHIPWFYAFVAIFAFLINLLC